MVCNLMDEAALDEVQAFIDKRAPDWKQQPPPSPIVPALLGRH